MLDFEQTQNKGQMHLCQTTCPITRFGTLSLFCSSALSRDSRGEIHFPRTPHFLLCAGLSFPVGCALTARGGGLCPPYLSACAANSPPALRAAAEGLRSAAFTFVAPAPRCPLRLPPNRAVRSHPLRGAYRAFFAGHLCHLASHTLYYAQKSTALI